VRAFVNSATEYGPGSSDIGVGATRVFKKPAVIDANEACCRRRGDHIVRAVDKIRMAEPPIHPWCRRARPQPVRRRCRKWELALRWGRAGTQRNDVREQIDVWVSGAGERLQGPVDCIADTGPRPMQRSCVDGHLQHCCQGIDQGWGGRQGGVRTQATWVVIAVVDSPAMPRAFITGVTGQDGYHLAEFLHTKGYDVYGMVKGQNNPRAAKLQEELPFLELVPGDLADLPSLVAALQIAQPDEVYNLGAISFVALSFSQAELTANITGLGVLRMLEAIRMVGGAQNNPIRFYQASSSEMFGKVRETPQTELTPFHPRSPYGCAKVFGHDIVVNYRESYDLFACSGILFNHEGPRRGLEFVTRKVTNAAARIKLGLQHELVMGTLDAKRDWGYAADYVKGMWMMLQQDEPDDFVLATGEAHSVQELVELSFAAVGINDWEQYVRQDPKFYRPAEVDLLIGDPIKAKKQLGWEPEVDFSTLINMMVENDLAIEAGKAK
jgi:GDPmannose 4,6-dehydratase